MSAVWRRFTFVVTCLAAALGSAAARAEPTDAAWNLPRGAEAAVLTWLEPLHDEADVVAGWRLNKIALEETKLRLCVESANDGKSACALVTPEKSALILSCEPTLPAPVCARFHAVLDGRMLSASPWHHAEKAVAVKDRPPPWWHVSPRQRADAAWLVWLLALAVTLQRLPRRWPPIRTAGVAAVTLLSLTVRLLWSPRTFLHEGYRIDLHTQFLRDGSIWPYGEGLTSAAVALQRLTGLNVDALFLLNLGLSTLAVPFCLAFAGRLFAWNRGVWAGGILLALSPLLVRWSACEEPGPLLLLMTSTAAFAAHLWLDENPRLRIPALVLTTASCVLTVHARPEWLPFPLLLLLLPWTTGQRPRMPPILFLAAALVAGYLIAPLWLDRRGSLQHLPNVDLTAAARVIALWDPRLTLPGYALVFVAGLVRALQLARRPTLWLLAAIGCTTAMGLMFFATEGPYAERMQFVPVAWSALLAGQAVNWLPQRWSARLTTGIAGAFAVAQLLYCLPEVTRLYTLQTQWQAQQVAAQLLPNHARLIARADGSMDHFPRIAFDRAGKQVVLVDLSGLVTSNAWPTGDDVYLWLGMACWLEPMSDAPDLTTPRATCDAVRRRLTLAPVREWHLTEVGTPPHPHVPMPPGGYVVGLYRVLGEQRPTLTP